MRIAYIILGSVWILLLSSTEVKGECTKPTTTENAVIHEGDIEKETFADQDRVRLKCHPGYEPTKDSPMRLTCTGVQWIPPPERFNCQKKTCGNPGDIMYGKYEYLSGNEFGDIIQPQCNLGYYLLGSPDQQRVCMANGEWDGQEPVCEVIKCEAPPTITNGRPKFPPEDEYEYNHVVEYVCDAGTLLGDSSIRCLLNKSWSNAPQCKVVNCPKRPDIPNAERIGGNSGPYGYMATLTYECVKGYRMAAGSTGTVVCKEMGWTHTLVCEEIICPPVKPTNATITEGAVGPYRPGSIIRYRCQDGQTLAGSSTLNCQSDGQWSSGPPVCKVVTCPEAKKTNAVIVSRAGGPYTVNWVLKYECPDGTHRNGNDQIICQPDGHWSSEPPVCEEDSGSRKKLLSWLLPSLGLGLSGGGFLVWWFVFRKKKNRISS